MSNSIAAKRSIRSKTTIALILLPAILLAVRCLPGSEQDDFAKSVKIVVETLKFMGEDKTAGDFLESIRLKRINIGNLPDSQMAVTGTNNPAGVGPNYMTLDETFLVLGRSEILWKRKKYDSPLNYLAWAETLVHEYVHMHTPDPHNVPKDEDPAYLLVAQTHVRWFNRLNKMFALIAANEKNPQVKLLKLRGLRRILKSLEMLQGPFREAVARKIKDHSLNPHLPFANIGLEAKIWDVFKQIDAELKATEAKIAVAKTPKAGTPVPTPTPAPGQSGWYREGAPAIEKSLNKPDACYPSATLDISDGAATGTRTWADCSKATKCSGTYVGRLTWTPLPAYMQPGKEVGFAATAGTTASNTCGSRFFTSWLVIKHNGTTFISAGESQYSGPPKATGKFIPPPGQPGAKLVIEAHLCASSLNGKAIYTYVYK